MTTILTVTTTADQNNGNTADGLSLREAIRIANANPNTDYEIRLTGGATYTLTANGINEDNALTGDLDITNRNNVLLITTTNGQKSTINASGLINSERVFEVRYGGKLSLQNVVVTGGLSQSSGGGIRVNSNGSLDLNNTTITGNQASGSSSIGGGIYNFRGIVYLRNGSRVSNNMAVGNSGQEGGGIYNAGGTLIAINSTINNNEGGVYGGGISTVSGSLTLINTTVSGNSAGNGGGIRNNGTSIALINTTVSGNNATYKGGGIYTSGDIFNLLNSTVTNNTVVSTQFGEGGGGIYTLSTTVNLKNTIVAGNTDNHNKGPDLLSSVLSSAIFNGNNYNLIGNLTGAKGTIGTGTDIVNPNPNLGLLGNNGGLTLTHALLPGSVAINAGNNALIPADTEDLDGDGDTTEPIPYDQRGLLRLSGAKVDIGAFEVQPPPLPKLSINDVTLVERKNGQATLTVTLSSASSQAVTVNYATTAVTATANADYTSKTGTLTLAANTTTASINIPILNDNLNEPNETFKVTLSNPTNAILQKATGTVTITDTLTASVTTTLPTQVENLTLTGTANINGTGNAGNNILTGNAGNNTLAGSNGNDTYRFNASTSLGTDTISETTTGGIDTLNFAGTNTAVRVNLGISTTQTVNSNLKLILSANNVIENIIGSNNSDHLIGNSLNNTLNGSSGNDVLSGRSGIDSLIGGVGDDLLTGGANSDRFFYNSGRTFVRGDLGIDTITDFTVGSDKILLSKTTFSALTSVVGNGLSQASDFATVEDDDLAATSKAFLVYSNSSGSLFYNPNGSAAGLGNGAELVNFLNFPTLTSADFTVIA